MSDALKFFKDFDKRIASAKNPRADFDPRTIVSMLEVDNIENSYAGLGYTDFKFKTGHIIWFDQKTNTMKITYPNSDFTSMPMPKTNKEFWDLMSAFNLNE